MKRILVTGGAGFLGSSLCRLLVQDETNQVIALDDFSTGRRENLQELLGRPNFELLEWDVVKPIDLPVDQIYNAACPASPRAYQKHPTATVKTCVIGTLNLLELARKYHAVLLQFSTSEVYGDALLHPQSEDYWGNVNPDGVRSCYDEGKRCAESLCFAYEREFGTRIKVVRIFNTYGPCMNPNDGRVVPNLMLQALTGRDLTIYGDGTQTRSFCYVDDLLEGILAMMRSPAEFSGPVNLGNPHACTMLELAAQVLAVTGSRSRLTFCPLPGDDPKRRCPDITLAKEKLGWSPKTCLKEGLQKTAAYYQRLLSGEG